MNLRGAFVDLGDLGIAEVALQRHFLGIAHAAVDLHGLMGDPHRRFRGGELGHRCFGAELLALPLEPGRAQGEQQGCVELALHVGDLGLGHLEGADRRAKRLALLHIGQRGLIGRARNAHCLGGNADPACIEHAHRSLEALAFRAQHLVRLRYVIGELNLAGGRGADAELGLGLAAMEAGARRINHESSNAARALVRLGHREQHDVLGHRAGGDPALLAIDDEAAIALLDRTATHGRGIRTGLRLGQRERADVRAFSDCAHVQLLLRLGAVLQDAGAEQRIVDRHDGGVRAIGGGNLDHRQRIADRVHAGAAVLGRHLDAHQAVLAQQLDVLQRKLAAAVELLGAGGDLFLRDPAGHVLDHQLFFGKAEIHVRPLPGIG